MNEEDKKLAKMLTYGMSIDGITKLMSDIASATKEALNNMSSYKGIIEELEKEDPERAKEYEKEINIAIAEAKNNMQESYDNIRLLFERVKEDWDNYKG